MRGAISGKPSNRVHRIHSAALRRQLHRNREQRDHNSEFRAAAHATYLTLGARNDTRSTRGTSRWITSNAVT